MLIGKPIPGYPDYYASNSGIIYNEDMVPLTEGVNKWGYRSVSLKDANGKYKSHMVHRLIALTWIFCNGNPDDFVINHIDGDPSNNAVYNLEWTTNALNALHSSLICRNNKRFRMYMVDVDGSYSYVRNLWTATEILGITIHKAWELVRDNLDFNGIKLYPITNRRALPKQLHKPSIVSAELTPRQIKVKDIITGEVIHFDSQHSAGRHFGVGTSHIYSSITMDEDVRIFKKRYVIVDKDNDFPEISQERIDICNRSGGILTYWWKEGMDEIMSSSSAASFIRENGLSKVSVTRQLHDKRCGQSNGYYFAYSEKLEWLQANRSSSSG